MPIEIPNVTLIKINTIDHNLLLLVIIGFVITLGAWLVSAFLLNDGDYVESVLSFAISIIVAISVYICVNKFSYAETTYEVLVNKTTNIEEVDKEIEEYYNIVEKCGYTRKIELKEGVMTGD